MSIVIGIAELGSLSAASRRLGMPVQSLSRKLQELELRLNVELFQRSSRGLVLTEAGRSYVEACRRILNEVAEAEREASREYSIPTGDLTVTAPWGLGHLHLIPIVCEFQHAHPLVNVRLLLTDNVLHPSSGNIDLAIRIGPLQDSSLKASRLGSVRVVTCGSPSYFRSHGIPRNPMDLEKHNCILTSDTTVKSAWRFQQAGRSFTVPIHSSLIVNTSEAAVIAALAGAGIARVMDYKMHSAQTAGELVTILDEFELEPVPIHAVYTNRNPMPVKLRTFLDLVLPEIRKRLGGSKVSVDGN